MYINERTNCSWQKHATKENRFRDTDSLRSNKSSTSAAVGRLSRVAKDLFRIHQVTTKVAGFQHIEKWPRNCWPNGISLDWTFEVASPPHFLLAGLLVHQQFAIWNPHFSWTKTPVVLGYHGGTPGIQHSSSVFFFEIPDLGPPKTQRVFWVKPSFSSSTLRKTNMYTIL